MQAKRVILEMGSGNDLHGGDIIGDRRAHRR